MSRSIISLVSTAVLIASGGISSFAAQTLSTQDQSNTSAATPTAIWSSWGDNLNNTRSSSSERTINQDNVNKLHTKWIFKTAGDVSATPTVEGDAVYAVDWGGGIYRINAQTGKAVWSKMLPTLTGNSMSFARTSPAIGTSTVIIGDQASGTVIALDKNTGDIVWQTVVDPLAAAFITTSPVISDGIVYIGVASGEEGLAATDPHYVFKFRGSIQALDLTSGKVIWKSYTVPSGYTGGAVWGSNFIIDHKRNALVATTGNNYTVPKDVSECLLKAEGSVSDELACLSPQDYIDSVISLNLTTGKPRWNQRLEGADTWTEGCIVKGGTPCPDPAGPDYDLGAGANLITLANGTQVIGAGQKSGVYWGLDPDSGAVVYGTQVGPGGNYGGIEWGTATDNARVYVPIENFYHYTYSLAASGDTWNGGSWAALNPSDGRILWQIKVPGNDPHHPTLPSGALAPVSTANGVVYGGSMSGYFVAMRATDGKILWQYQSGGSVNCGPAIVNGTVYWGSGYRNDPSRLGGKGNNKLYAFTLEASTTE